MKAKERPIIFTSESVRAIREGRKTQTRRSIKPQPFCPGGHFVWMEHGNPPHWRFQPKYLNQQDGTGVLHACPYGVPGNLLWVRETWQCGMAATPSGYGLRVRIGKAEQGDVLRYRADGDDYVPPMPWRSPLFMPRWASRLTLEVIGVSVQRVQDIPVIDIEREGLSNKDTTRPGHRISDRELVANYVRLWDSINAKRGFGWNVNPWVWVVEFRRVEP